MSRDLVGYGGRPPDVVWPNGTRLAVSVVVNFEEGAEWQVGDGDPRSETVGEVGSVVPAGVRDRGQEQIFAYGTRAGFWRILDGLTAADVPATFLACGQAVARAPALVRAAADRGHEIAAHGWRWRAHADYPSAVTEAADLDRTAATIAAAAGAKPVGFFCRGGESAWTRDLLRGRRYLYTSNGLDDDLPYWDGGLLVVPYGLDSNDMKFFHPNGFVRADDMVAYVADALETLEAEAARGLPRLLSIGFHLRIVGRPGRYPAFSRVLTLLAARRDRVWLARRREIASAFATQVPPP